MFSIYFLVFCNALISLGHNIDEDKEPDKPKNVDKPIVLLIALDGFRWDYLNRLKELKQNSTFWTLIEKDGAIYEPDGLLSTFATVTFPNMYTIATGLYQESHGVIANTVYDVRSNKVYNLERDDHYGNLSFIYGGEPIWRTVARQVGKNEVACFMWVGCVYGGLNRNNFVPFASGSTWSHVVSNLTTWFKAGVRLAVVYWTQPDSPGHRKGPDSPEMNQTLIEIDQNLSYLNAQLKSQNGLIVGQNLNLVIVSDHGMTKLIDVVVIPEKDSFQLRSLGTTFWHVEPKPGKLDEVYGYFKSYPHLDVYHKEDIPENWHYAKNERVSQILVVAHPGYWLSTKPDTTGEIWGGIHGYDPKFKDMRGLFFVHGPAFKKSQKSSPPTKNGLSVIDIYLLICKLLAVKPSPNNGSEIIVDPLLNLGFLRNFEGPVSKSNIIFVGILSAMVLTFVSIIFFLHRCSVEKRRRFWANHAQHMGDGGSYVTYRQSDAAPLLLKGGANELKLNDTSDDDESV